MAAVAPGEPHPEPRHPHGGGHPAPVPPQPGTRLLRPQDRRGQDTEGSAARPQASGQRRPLGRHGRRRSTRRRHGHEGGLGRATGERLCRQRGRLTPRDAGSSAKPLPNPTQGYDDEAAPATDGDTNVSDRPKNCLTNKEDSFCASARPHPGRGAVRAR